MNARPVERVCPLHHRDPFRQGWSGLLLVLGLLLIGPGCTLLRRDPTPGRTTFDAPLSSVPATLTANTLMVELTWDKFGPWRFLVDTGSSVTLVSPEFAARYVTATPTTQTPKVNVRSASGETTQLTGVT
jgi:hypothetical protein